MKNTALQLIHDYERQGWQFSTNGDSLKLKHPEGALTKEIKYKLQENKSQIIELLKTKFHEPSGDIKKRIQTEWDNALRRFEKAWTPEIYEQIKTIDPHIYSQKKRAEALLDQTWIGVHGGTLRFRDFQIALEGWVHAVEALIKKLNNEGR